MDSSKTENRETAEESTAAKKKSRLKKLVIWLFIDLLVACLVILLLLYRPGRYNPLSPAGFKPGQVSPYLTLFHSAVYDGVQLGEPFDAAISQEGINDIIARGGLDWNWPLEREGVMLYAPAVVLEPGIAVLMGTANVKGIELVVTIELEPEITDNGLSRLKVKKLKVGAINITPIAKMMGKKTYTEQLAAARTDKETWQMKVVASLLNNEPFTPIFPTGKKNLRVRVGKIAIQKGKLSLRLIPVR